MGWFQVGNKEPTGNGVIGKDGSSAYEIAVKNGFVGTEIEWLQSLDGEDGSSAYEIAVKNGFVGTETEWLESLKGGDDNNPSITLPISVEDVEETSTKQFISEEEKVQITTNTGDLDNLKKISHSHINKLVLDNLGDAGDTLSYKGQPLGKVAYMSVETLADRDAIPYDQRTEGLFVLIRSDGSSYYLKGGIDNAFWEIFAIGAGGATNASTLSANPTGSLIGTNVQSILDELEKNKVSYKDAYTKLEVDNKIENAVVDYNTLVNLPDLSSLHNHNNKETLDLFSQYLGELTWNGKTFGNMVADIYDQDKDGVIDKATTLEGLIASISELNYTKGVTSNIQQQINAISSGTVFKGEFATYADLIANHTPSKSDWVFVVSDETKNGARTQYYYDGSSWIFGGGATSISDATSVTTGGIMLNGDLFNENGTASSPQLSLTGVVAGLYKNPNIIVDEKGRVTFAENGGAAFVNDKNISLEETWSSQKMNDLLFAKADKTHTHKQLHDANMLGDTQLDTSTREDGYVITYNAQKAMAEWTKSQGGKVLVGSKYIEGDYKLVAGSYINLFIDEVQKTITINSTFRDEVTSGVPSLTEITDTVLVPAGGFVRISKEAAFNKYMVNVVRVENSENNTMDIAIFEEAESDDYEYLSNKLQKIHDILYLPIIDKDNTKMIHLKLTNYGATDTYASFKIKTTNLI